MYFCQNTFKHTSLLVIFKTIDASQFLGQRVIECSTPPPADASQFLGQRVIECSTPSQLTLDIYNYTLVNMILAHNNIFLVQGSVEILFTWRTCYTLS